MSLEATDLDFDVLREPWNLYQLEDGTILRVKYVLTRVVRQRDNMDRIGYAFKGQNVVSLSHFPKELKGPPSPSPRMYTPEELQSAIVNDNVRYSTLEEEWNEYVTEDGANIRVKITVVKVSRTNKTDNEGEPIYLVATSLLPQVIPPKKL
ncbi:MAG: hypothetical protein QXV37_03365 [Candidatus Jordarchaeaceae archaeon]